MAMNSLERDGAWIMHCLNAHNCALKRRPLDGDSNFEQLPVRAGVRREQCDGF